MLTYAPIVAVLAVVLLVLVWWRMRQRGQAGAAAEPGDRLDTLVAWPPKVTRILTSQERIAHGILLRAFPDHLVLAQVPLSRFLRVPTRYSHAEWLRRVGQLCADLVVCDTSTQPLAVIIVEAPGGAPNERARVRHARMVRVLKAAGVRCFVWIENAFPTVEFARASVLDTARQAAPVAPVREAVPELVTDGPDDHAPAAPRAAAAAPGPVVVAAHDSQAFDDTRRDSRQHESLDESEPPPTWYDDLNSGPTPLQPAKPRPPGER